MDRAAKEARLRAEVQGEEVADGRATGRCDARADERRRGGQGTSDLLMRRS